MKFEFKKKMIMIKKMMIMAMYQVKQRFQIPHTTARAVCYLSPGRLAVPSATHPSPRARLPAPVSPRPSPRAFPTRPSPRARLPAPVSPRFLSGPVSPSLSPRTRLPALVSPGSSPRTSLRGSFSLCPSPRVLRPVPVSPGPSARARLPRSFGRCPSTRAPHPSTGAPGGVPLGLSASLARLPAGLPARLPFRAIIDYFILLTYPFSISICGGLNVTWRHWGLSISLPSMGFHGLMLSGSGSVSSLGGSGMETHSCCVTQRRS